MGTAALGVCLQGPFYSLSLLVFTEASGTPEWKEETSRGGSTLSCLPLLIDLEDRGYIQVPFLPTLTGPLLAISRYLALAQHTSRLDAFSWAWWGPQMSRAKSRMMGTSESFLNLQGPNALSIFPQFPLIK